MLSGRAWKRHAMTTPKKHITLYKQSVAIRDLSLSGY